MPVRPRGRESRHTDHVGRLRPLLAHLAGCTAIGSPDSDQCNGTDIAGVPVMYGAFTTWVVDYGTRIDGREPAEADLESYTWALWQHASRDRRAYLMVIMDLQAFSRVVAPVSVHTTWFNQRYRSSSETS